MLDVSFHLFEVGNHVQYMFNICSIFVQWLLDVSSHLLEDGYVGNHVQLGCPQPSPAPNNELSLFLTLDVSLHNFLPIFCQCSSITLPLLSLDPPSSLPTSSLYLVRSRTASTARLLSADPHFAWSEDDITVTTTSHQGLSWQWHWGTRWGTSWKRLGKGVGQGGGRTASKPEPRLATYSFPLPWKSTWHPNSHRRVTDLGFGRRQISRNPLKCEKWK